MRANAPKVAEKWTKEHGSVCKDVPKSATKGKSSSGSRSGSRRK
jgi:hypothetical protein